MAIRISNREIDPLYGAAGRFAVAALVFAGIVAAGRTPWPRGRQLVGAVLYGVLNFALAYGFIYEGLRFEAQRGRQEDRGQGRGGEDDLGNARMDGARDTDRMAVFPTSSALPASLQVGSKFQREAPADWIRQRREWARELGREGLLASGADPIEMVREERAVRLAGRGRHG